MWLKWLPWRFIVSRGARARGFLDPISIMTKLGRFAQPSEVSEPIELLRAGVVFHARGLMNTRAIQHNLDWVWPYWVERQFDPADESFIPRAFSITHVNLTHRNWTGVGLPGYEGVPIVDPRGLVTPFFDGWSLDFWLVDSRGQGLYPSRLRDAGQRLELGERPSIVSEAAARGRAIVSRVWVEPGESAPSLYLSVSAESDEPLWLACGIRPYNPEGVSFVHDIAVSEDGDEWLVNGVHRVQTSRPAERVALSCYHTGDVISHLDGERREPRISCDVGMATGAALFAVRPGERREIEVRVPLEAPPKNRPPRRDWSAMNAGPRAVLPDADFVRIYEASRYTLLLLAPREVYPGPYTYKRFWFRDAALILHALICEGYLEESERVIDTFRSRQGSDGYFLSQEGEWDSNGEALWAMWRYCELSGRPPKPSWKVSIIEAARWIMRKRLRFEHKAPHAGLLPAGFSAEHLGPNDYYYWDDYWGVAGLRAASKLCDAMGYPGLAVEFSSNAALFLDAIDTSIARVAEERGLGAIPASPYRRMDAGSIGSIVCGYPLALVEPRDHRLLGTIEYLLQSCMVGGGFFQEMIHSGINAYLTLHMAQVLLRAGDQRFFELTRAVADLASPTGQWPEAVHPRTFGGCMGDGQHSWASAEWIMMIRNMFVREEGSGLVLASGVPEEWLKNGREMLYGPTLTPFGPVSVTVVPEGPRVRVSCSGDWRGDRPLLTVALPGRDPVVFGAHDTEVTVPGRA